MNAAERNRGRAPPTARSFTVPWTASLPMSPPGKKIGRTTNESVVNANRGALGPFMPETADGGLILERAEDVIGKRRHEQPLDQIGGQPAAAAVAQQDVLVVGQAARDS